LLEERNLTISEQRLKSAKIRVKLSEKFLGANQGATLNPHYLPLSFHAYFNARERDFRDV
jgi:hypothetical protein